MSSIVCIDEVITITDPYYENTQFYYNFGKSLGLVEGNVYNVTFLGETFTNIKCNDTYKMITFKLSNGATIHLSDESIRSDVNDGLIRPFNADIKIVDISPKIHKLDEKYIPDAIARIDDVMSNYNPVGTGSFSMNRKADTVSGNYSHTEGYNGTASGNYSHAEGNGTKALGYVSHAEGSSTTASGDYSHAEGGTNTASGNYSHAEGGRTTASGSHSHAEGYYATASGSYSHAEGSSTTASGTCSHAEGVSTTASGMDSHAEGYDTTASKQASHAEGYYTTASGFASHVEGYHTTASGDHSHVQGKYNIEDTEDKYAHIVGNGTSEQSSNAHTLDWNGLGWFAGGLKIGGTGQDDTAAKEVATKDYVDNSIADIPDGIYVHNEEPVDAEDGTLWLDTDEEAAVSGSGANEIPFIDLVALGLPAVTKGITVSTENGVGELKELMKKGPFKSKVLYSFGEDMIIEVTAIGNPIAVEAMDIYQVCSMGYFQDSVLLLVLYIENNKIHFRVEG